MQTNEQGLWIYHRKWSLFERRPNTRLLRKRNPGVKHQSISRSNSAHVNRYNRGGRDQKFSSIDCSSSVDEYCTDIIIGIYMDKCLKHYIPCSVLKIAGIRMGKFVECVSICLKGQTMQKVTICQLMFLVVETCNMQGLIPENTLSFELSRCCDHAWAVKTQVGGG